ncbi:MAG: hypothetical protein KAG97_01575 [Victivallales bacterium]|nr:hypothetical protein [Victivallales bacterium]
MKCSSEESAHSPTNNPHPHSLRLFSTSILLSAATILVVSCESLPPGEPPEGAIISEPELNLPRLNGARAVNHMLTTLAMRCEPISGAGAITPLVSNRFLVSRDAVNDLPMDVWRKLIRMKLIRPVDDTNPKARYRLESEITKMVVETNKSNTYIWKLKLKDIKQKKTVWDEILKFTKQTSR